MNALLDPHPADDVLVRVLDRESTADELPHARVHIDGCSTCTDRLRTLEQRTRTLSALLRESDPAMPTLRPPATAPPTADRAWLRAAAVLLVLAGLGVMASPARGRVLDWIRQTIGLANDPIATPAQTATPGDPPSIEFAFAGADLIVELTDATSTGELRFDAHDAGMVAARALAATARIDMLVLPIGLRIRNDGALADYEIALPASVERVSLRIGTRPVLVIGADALPCTVTVAQAAADRPACRGP